MPPLSSIETAHNTQEVIGWTTVESDINLAPESPTLRPPDQPQWKLKLLREILHILFFQFLDVEWLTWPSIKTLVFFSHLEPFHNCTKNLREVNDVSSRNKTFSVLPY